MPAIDVGALLEPISDDAPCGPSVEYDERYIELERLARGVAQEENAEGKVIREAEAPNWVEVERGATDLCKESKDLRVGIYLARARLAADGLSGFRDVLDLLEGYVSRYWASVHPQLDPADNDDPSIRVNALLALSDNATMLRLLRMAPLTDSRQFGRISYRDYAIANGLMPPPPSGRSDDEKLPDASRIDAAFADTDIEWLKNTQRAAAGSVEALSVIDSALDEAVGAGNGPDLAPLKKLLGDINDLLALQVAKRGGGEPNEPTDGGGGMTGEGMARGGDGAGRGLAASGAVRSREDVLLLLDKICRYYSDYEPSSPVPLILNRTKRLVTMSFLDILKDLTPGGVQEFGVIAGIKEEE
jgi:type VI secretion system protein ImpA